MKKTLFIFRRDLRLEDNTGLLFALKNSDEVIPCFIQTPEQLKHNRYKSEHAVEFMFDALRDLRDSLKHREGRLYLFEGVPHAVVERCIRELEIDGVVVNRDYTPYSVARDHKIEKVCKKHDVAFHSFDDLLLHPPEETLKSDGKPYTIFTPYFKNSSRMKVPLPQKNRASNYFTKPIRFSHELAGTAKGGRSEGLTLLRSLKRLGGYAKNRDLPGLDATSHLSPHLKFTTLSPREVYHAIVKTLGPHSELVRALYWRDFFTQIGLFFPHVFKGPFHQKFRHLKWRSDKRAFRRWCEGKTGFPLVDAGMRQLNATGSMHNRVRMVVASFLVKDLHLNWQWGERYFATHLTDYDPAVNNGNWQWCASTGCDAQPYFRIFNPWNQAKKFDPDCTYIKAWVPELAELTPEEIHGWDDEQHHTKCPAYPAPIVDHKKQSQRAVNSWAAAR